MKYIIIIIVEIFLEAVFVFNNLVQRGMLMRNNTSSVHIQAKMASFRNSLSRMEQKVIDYILDHPNEVIYLSVAGLAEKAGTSDATVIRTCRKLGLDGYQDLKVSLAQDIVTPLQDIQEEIEDGDSIGTVVSKCFFSAAQALQYTQDIQNAADIEKAADILFNARRVFLFAMGNSFPTALDLQNKLMHLDICAIAYENSHTQAVAASMLGAEDVAVAISHSGSSKDVVDAAKIAKSNHAFVISITNNMRSPLYNVADLPLCTASKETQYRVFSLSSRIAQMTLNYVLHTVIAYKHTEVVFDRFRQAEKSVKSKKY